MILMIQLLGFNLHITQFLKELSILLMN